MVDNEIVLVVTGDSETPEEEGQRGGWNSVQERLTKVASIPAAVLEQNMNHFLQVVGRLFQQVDQQVGSKSNLYLNEVELQVEISSKGELKLIAGGEAAGKGVITLKFKRLA